MADETRVRILHLLLDNEATTSELVGRLGLEQPRVSAHLAVLRKTGLVSASIVGRQHVYRMRPEVADTIRTFFRLASPARSDLQIRASTIGARASLEVGRDSPLRRARTCYDHLAGIAGVELLDEMMKRGWFESRMDHERGRTIFDLTDTGKRSLQRLGVGVTIKPAPKRLFAFGCLDWTERKYHLGGYLGKLCLESLLADGFVEKRARKNSSRVVVVHKPIRQWLSSPMKARQMRTKNAGRKHC